MLRTNVLHCENPARVRVRVRDYDRLQNNTLIFNQHVIIIRQMKRVHPFIYFMSQSVDYKQNNMKNERTESVQ